MAQVTIADVRHDPRGPDRAAALALLARAARRPALVARGRGGRARGAAAARDAHWVQRVREPSKQRHWALDLRLSLLVLFTLAWLAQRSGTSILIAGFGAGVAVAMIGGPKRLSTQVRGVADGFFVPLYFVVLGASLDVGALFANRRCSASPAALVGPQRRDPPARRGLMRTLPRARSPPAPSSACPPPSPRSASPPTCSATDRDSDRGLRAAQPRGRHGRRAAAGRADSGTPLRRGRPRRAPRASSARGGGSGTPAAA